MLAEIAPEFFIQQRLDNTFDLAVTELGLCLSLEINHLWMNRRLGAIEMFDKGRQAALVKELVLFLCALVFDGDLDTAIEECELAQSLRENVETKIRRLKNFTIRFERHPRAALFGLADFFESFLRIPAPVTLLVYFSIALDLDFQSLGQRVDDRNTHAVQTAGNFVRGFVELAAGMEFGEHDFGGGNV